MYEIHTNNQEQVAYTGSTLIVSFYCAETAKD